MIWTSLAIAIGLGIWRPMQTAVALIGLCTLGYVLTMIDRVQIFRQGLPGDCHHRPRGPRHPG